MILVVLIDALAGIGFIYAAGALPLLWRRVRPVQVLAFPIGLAIVTLVIAAGLLVGAPNWAIKTALWLFVGGGWALLARRRRGELLGVARDAEWTPLGLWLLFGLVQASFIALPDVAALDVSHQLDTAALPVDALLPYRVSEMIVLRESPLTTLFWTGWRLCDRGPLLGTGFAAARLALGYGSYARFVVFGTLANAYFVAPSVVLLKGRRPVAIFFLLIVLNHFVTLNTWFTWPKLMATGMVLAAIVVLERSAALAGALFTLAYLSHGVVAFAGPVLALVVLRRRPRHLAPFAAAAIGTLVPWLVYKRFFDTDTDRLLKYHLFGVTEETAVPLRTIAAEYWRTHSLAEMARIRFSNLVEPWRIEHLLDGVRNLLRGEGRAALWSLRNHSFTNFVGALGLPVFIAALRSDKRLWIFGPLAVAVVLFGTQAATTNHQWCYVPLALALIGAATVLAESRVSSLVIGYAVVTDVPLIYRVIEWGALGGAVHLLLLGAAVAVGVRGLRR